MRIVISDFISLDGVIQAPGGEEEDTDGGFQHGGWSMPYFDVDTMGPAVGEVMERFAELEACFLNVPLPPATCPATGT